MRVDAFLKKILLFKKRAEAKAMCERGYVRINGNLAKPSRTINEDDIIEIETPNGLRRLRVLQIPCGNIRRDEIAQYYKDENRH